MTCVRERRSFHLALQADGPEHFPETGIQAEVDAGEINEALYIPLIADGQVIGCIGLLLDAGSPLGRDELALARALAGQAGFAIHHGRLFRESQCSAEFRAGLGETMVAMIAARDLDAVVGVVCCGAVKLLNCSPALVCLIDDDTERLHGCVARHGGPNEPRRFERALRAGRRAHEEVAGSGAPVCLTPGSLKGLGLDGIEAELDNNVPILIAPFNVRGHMLGYMMLPVSMNGGERDFVERAMLFAQQAALAIETAVLIQDLKQAFVALDNAQQSLVESERLASLGEMAASLSHEIRNPLGTITSAVGLLQLEHLDGAERRELLELMESEVNRLNHLVSDTLDFARPARVREQCFELRPLIDQIVRMASVRFPDLVVEKELPEDLPDLSGEVAEIQQVLANLLDNAAAATQGKGAVLLRVRLEAEQVWFEILDSGPGIPHEMRNRVFEPFETTKPDGVGLGLVIVHRIVSNWGGTLDLESEPGNGTRVAFCLPLPGAPGMSKEVSYDG
jgi:signal transduction histidine kinase